MAINVCVTNIMSYFQNSSTASTRGSTGVDEHCMTALVVLFDVMLLPVVQSVEDSFNVMPEWKHLETMTVHRLTENPNKKQIHNAKTVCVTYVHVELK